MGNLFALDSPLYRFVNKLLHLLWLSFLWFVCCLPIVTIGASTAALYTITLKYVRNEEGYIATAFFCAFRQNFKQASIIWGILLISGLALGLDVILYSRSQTVGLVPFLLLTVFLSLFVVFILIHIYIYPLLAKFNNTIPRTFLNALIMAVRHWPSSISMLMISIAILIVGAYAFPPLLFLAPALSAYINSRFLVKIFDQYLNCA